MTDVEQLTTRERQVLALLRQGLSDREIATTLFMSPRTVEKFVARLIVKTGATERGQLATGPIS